MARNSDVRYIRYYTDGTAALQPAPVKTHQTRQAPRPARKQAKRKRVTLYIDPLAIAGIVVAAVMLALMLVGVVQLERAHEQTQRMTALVTELEREHQRLQGDYDDRVDLEEIQWMADALGLVPVEEVPHIVLPAPQSEPVEEPSVWERFCTYLTSLFA